MIGNRIKYQSNASRTVQTQAKEPSSNGWSHIHQYESRNACKKAVYDRQNSASMLDLTIVEKKLLSN